MGATGVSWHLDLQSGIHAAYQGLLKGLTDQGVLLAIASKNDPEVAGIALACKDLRFDLNKVFPVEISWGAKSEAIERILSCWNIGADSVVFVDDSPLEVAEVQSRLPGITALVFPTNDDASVLRLMGNLRDLFGRCRISEEDRLRTTTIRQSAEMRSKGAVQDSVGTEDFLKSLDAILTFNFRVDPSDIRPLDLVNKTNQFNLNGRRLDPADWKRNLRDPEKFVLTVDYSDKFGPLGTIGVVIGYISEGNIVLTAWVLSCRAFARRIEHAVLDLLTSYFDIESIVFEYQSTDKNRLVHAFLSSLGTIFGSLPAEPIISTLSLPPLYHKRQVHD